MAVFISTWLLEEDNMNKDTFYLHVLWYKTEMFYLILEISGILKWASKGQVVFINPFQYEEILY